MNIIAHFIVWLYDLYLRKRMTSYYLYLDQFENIDQYYASLEHSFRSYFLSNIKKFERYRDQQQLFVSDDHVNHLDGQLRAFIWKVFQQKKDSTALYYFYIALYSILLKAERPDVTIIKNSSQEIIAFYLAFPTEKVNYGLAALIDHSDPLAKNGSYFYHMKEVFNLCFNQRIPVMRLGPTVDELKTKLGGQAEKGYRFHREHNFFHRKQK